MTKRIKSSDMIRLHMPGKSLLVGGEPILLLLDHVLIGGQHSNSKSGGWHLHVDGNLFGRRRLTWRANAKDMVS